MTKLIIDTTTGTILNLDGCVIVDMTEQEWSELDESASDSEIRSFGERKGISIEQLLEGK